MTRSDKRVTKCRFGHSELLIPRERAIKELYFDLGFETVHNAKVKAVVARRPFRENEGDRIYNALVRVDFLPFEVCFEVDYGSKWAVSSHNKIQEARSTRTICEFFRVKMLF